jgi:predicted DNA-binding helix-hairpin-helix protein
MIVGATPESDSAIVHLAQGLYRKYGLKRVFYSAYIPVGGQPKLPVVDPPLLREHRLYQADWLLRFYGFSAQELFTRGQENLHLHLDPKCHWALGHLENFPMEINRADYMMLLRVPGIGQRSAKRILTARRVGALNFDHLKKIGVVLKRAQYFITCSGKMREGITWRPEVLEMKLTDNRYAQVSLFEKEPLWISAKS